MKKSRFTESQIVAVLKEGEAGVPVAEIVRKHGISRPGVGEREAEADVRGTRARECSDQRRAVPKVVTPSAKRQAIAIMTDQPHQLSIQRACRTVRLSRAAYYRPQRDRLVQDQPVIDALQAIVAKRTRWGFWKCYDRLRNQGEWWNHKRVHRVYCALRLNLPRRTRRRLPRRILHPLDAPPVLNRTWAIDYMCDTLYDGRRYRILNVIDEGNREGLAIDIGVSLPSVRLVALLAQLRAVHGTPKALRVDKWPELTSTALTTWCEDHHVALRYIQPGKP